MKKLNKNVAIYLRASEDEIINSPISLDAQEEKLRQYSSEKGFNLYEKHIYIDICAGSTETEDRSGLMQAFQDAGNKEFDTLIVYRLDRFFCNVRMLLNAVHQLDEHGVSFLSATESFDTSTPSGKCTFHFLASFAEHKNNIVREKSKYECPNSSRTYGRNI